MKYIIQYLIMLLLLAFSSLITWYEGSAIRRDPWEWPYTAFFSKIFNSKVANVSDISQLDHFIYAAKFKPVYPILILLSLTYILILTGHLLLKRHTKGLMVFLVSVGVTYALLGLIVSNSPTIGGAYFTVICLTISFINLSLAARLFFRLNKRMSKIGNKPASAK